MAFNAEGKLFVCDSRYAAVFRFRPDTGRLELFAKEAEGIVPDGLAVDSLGRLYVSYYEPSAVSRVGLDGTVETIRYDLEAIVLYHPTNCAFRGTSLFTVNLGKCHITELAVGIEGNPLPPV